MLVPAGPEAFGPTQCQHLLENDAPMAIEIKAGWLRAGMAAGWLTTRDDLIINSGK